MDDERKLKLANDTFLTLCNTLDKLEWHYDKMDDKLGILGAAIGDDLPIEFAVIINPDRQNVWFFSPLKIKVPEEKMLDFAVAINEVNFQLVNGRFEYDMSDGQIAFKMTNSFT